MNTSLGRKRLSCTVSSVHPKALKTEVGRLNTEARYPTTDLRHRLLVMNQSGPARKTISSTVLTRSPTSYLFCICFRWAFALPRLSKCIELCVMCFAGMSTPLLRSPRQLSRSLLMRSCSRASLTIVEGMPMAANWLCRSITHPTLPDFSRPSDGCFHT